MIEIVVCLRQTVGGEINPFDASAYEAALRIPDAEVTLLSMAAPRSGAFLTELTRLGAKRAILLTDPAFAGADTLATAYTLSQAIKQLSPDLILCGRQTIDGDTGQVGPELAVMAGFGLITNVMEFRVCDGEILCIDRDGRERKVSYPALLTVERIHALRFPSLRSKRVETEIWSANDIEADTSKCGLAGSPTRVIKTFENEQDRRKCTFIQPEELENAIRKGAAKGKKRLDIAESSTGKLKNVWIIGESPREMAETISDDITMISMEYEGKIAEMIREKQPEAVLLGSDRQSKRLAAQVAASLQLGLCADCTALETEGETLFMYRPAFSGNVIAKIRSLTKPQMATVRTIQPEAASIVVGVGAGAKHCLEQVRAFAGKLGADMVSSRVMVDQDYFSYEMQVGLTGKSINPDVYIALGISGAVHHVAGIRNAGTIIAVNIDADADIFKYADVGLVCDVEEVINEL